MITLALIGRPNVGKSTLFNRLVGQRAAIVGKTPGITRDRKRARAELYGGAFDLLDTPGIDPFPCQTYEHAMNEQSQAAMKEANCLLFIVNGKEKITNYDRAVADWIRVAFKKIGNRPVILVINKVEGPIPPQGEETLGFGEGVAISAEHALGLDELQRRIFEICSETPMDAEKPTSGDPPLKIAIVGRPNVGKSTLINAILGVERLLTGAQAGLTRDAITLDFIFKNRRISLIDTAGQRRKSKIDEKVEAMAIDDAWRHASQANVVVVVMDICNPLEKQDLIIAGKAFDEGKIVIFALNKSDSVPNPDEIVKRMQERMGKEFAQLPGVHCLLVSAKEKKGLARILNTALELYDKWAKRISTSMLNRWFQMALNENPPPMINGMPIRLKYIAQTNCRPPTFAIFANRVDCLPESYRRYLLNYLSRSFGFGGVPLRIFLRQRENPYDE
ncbi:MAG: ribosome biogenesis GTPase Der [Holosporaceae bacterium]|jgi:GTP-binding protein|nr:ribosome biogenesis GTPase Der [Holosporaceae bacterium]